MAVKRLCVVYCCVLYFGFDLTIKALVKVKYVPYFSEECLWGAHLPSSARKWTNHWSVMHGLCDQTHLQGITTLWLEPVW